MRKILVLGLALLMTLGLAGFAGAAVIDFDDLVSENQVPSNYQGFNWSESWYVYDDTSYMYYYGNTYGSTSGENAVFNGGGVMVSTVSGNTFNFLGAYFTGWASYNQSVWHTSESITVEGYYQGSLVGTASMNLSASQYDWLNAGLMGVDQLIFYSSGDSKWFLMDDFTYNTGAPVPIPGAVWLLGSGLVGLVGLRRKLQA
ncbi:MAG: VPLPA-CTERM sorting domain-containing protein [Thermodesulfobacteriota bacterium]